MDSRATMTVRELAERMGIGISKAYALVHLEGFPTLRLGRTILVPIEAFYKWLEKNTNMEGNAY